MTSIFTPFPLPLSGRQWFYLVVLQGVFAGVIDGGANFAVAYAMYHNQKSIKMWVLAENTLAGDLGVTPIIQTVASMLITSTLVHTDLHHKGVRPLSFVWPHVEHLPDPRVLLGRLGLGTAKDMKETGQGGRERRTEDDPSPETETVAPEEKEEERESRRRELGWRYFPLMLLRFTFEGTESNILLSPPSFSTFLSRVVLTAAQGAALGIICGLPIFLVFLVVLGPLYGHQNIAAEPGHWKWAPMVVKCVYGAVLGWITNPIIAALALGSQAEHHLLLVPLDEEQEQEQGVAHNGIGGKKKMMIPMEGEGEGQGEIKRSERGDELDLDGDGDLVPPTPAFAQGNDYQAPSPSSPTPTSTYFSLRPPPSSPSPSSNGLPPPSSPRSGTRTRPRTRDRAFSSLSSRSGKPRTPLTANASLLPFAPSPSSPRPSILPSSSASASANAGAGAGAGAGSSPAPLSLTLPPPSPGMARMATPTRAASATAVPSSAPPLPASSPGGLMVGSLGRTTRSRGMTVSSTSTSSGWSYALGGTGGRAQRRPRAATVSIANSATAAPAARAAPLVVPTTPNADSSAGAGRSGHPGGRGRGGVGPSSIGTERLRTDMDGARASAPVLPSAQQPAGSPPSTTGRGSGSVAVWDVFGQVAGTPAQSPRPARSPPHS